MRLPQPGCFWYLALLLLTLTNCFQPALAQTPSQIEDIVRRSKWVDKTRPVRAVVDRKVVSISTYCHAKASDQDCKINSLFILKGLLQRYKTVHRLRINFFEPGNMMRFRCVEVSEGDAALVDSGKPVTEVLDQIELSYGKMPTQIVTSRTGSSSASVSSTRSSNSLRTSSPTKSSSSQVRFLPSSTNTFTDPSSPRFTNYSTTGNDVSLLLPEGWAIKENSDAATLFVCNDGNNQFVLGRHELAKIGSANVAIANGNMASAAFPGYCKIKEAA